MTTETDERLCFSAYIHVLIPGAEGELGGGALLALSCAHSPRKESVHGKQVTVLLTGVSSGKETAPGHVPGHKHTPHNGFQTEIIYYIKLENSGGSWLPSMRGGILSLK